MPVEGEEEEKGVSCLFICLFVGRYAIDRNLSRGEKKTVLHTMKHRSPHW